MKTRAIPAIFVLTLLSINLSAQEAGSKDPKSLFSTKEGKPLTASFGVIDMNYTHTELFGQTLPGFAMNIGVVLGDHWLTGLSVQGSTTSQLSMGNPPIDLINPRYNYFFMGWNNALIISPYSIVNVSIPVKMGVGGVTYVHRFREGALNNARVDQDYFFVIEPGLDLSFNLSKNIALTTGASYRFAEGVQNAGTNADFAALFLNAGIRLRFSE